MENKNKNNTPQTAEDKKQPLSENLLKKERA